jgi:hypothetical protein
MRYILSLNLMLGALTNDRFQPCHSVTSALTRRKLGKGCRATDNLSGNSAVLDLRKVERLVVERDRTSRTRSGSAVPSLSMLPKYIRDG